MARFCSISSVGMFILTVLASSTSSQTVDERLQQFTTSFVRKHLWPTAVQIYVHSQSCPFLPDAIQESCRNQGDQIGVEKHSAGGSFRLNRNCWQPKWQSWNFPFRTSNLLQPAAIPEQLSSTQRKSSPLQTVKKMAVGDDWRVVRPVLEPWVTRLRINSKPFSRMSTRLD